MSPSQRRLRLVEPSPRDRATLALEAMEKLTEPLRASLEAVECITEPLRRAQEVLKR